MRKPKNSAATAASSPEPPVPSRYVVSLSLSRRSEDRASAHFAAFTVMATEAEVERLRNTIPRDIACVTIDPSEDLDAVEGELALAKTTLNMIAAAEAEVEPPAQPSNIEVMMQALKAMVVVYESSKAGIGSAQVAG